MYLRIRNLCGLLGILLPWIALFASAIKPDKHPGWWWSISATYYQAPEALIGVLVPASIVLMSYIGYNRADNIITTLNGLFGLGIVLFPCKVDWIASGTPVGFFQLPIEFSHTLHSCCAVAFFLCAAINILCQFTRHGTTMTEQKKVRNTIYRICGWGMIGLLAVLVLVVTLVSQGWWVMIIEILLLHLYGFAWLVKGEFFPFLNDKETVASSASKSTRSLTPSASEDSLRTEVDD